MTLIDVAFRYGAQPTEAQTRAMARVRALYGIWRMTHDKKERTLRVELRWIPSIGTSGRYFRHGRAGVDFQVTEYLSIRHECGGIVSLWLTRRTPETQRWLNTPHTSRDLPPERGTLR